MPRADERFDLRIGRNEVRSVRTEKPAKVVPLCENAEHAKWLLDQTEHKVVYDEMREVFTMGCVPGSSIEQLLQTFMDEYICALTWEGGLDRVIIGVKQFRTMLTDIEPWHGFAVRHDIRISQPIRGREFFLHACAGKKLETYDRVDVYGGPATNTIATALFDVTIQVLPNVDGILFVPNMVY